jgi:hypothetical protein
MFRQMFSLFRELNNFFANNYFLSALKRFSLKRERERERERERD